MKLQKLFFSILAVAALIAGCKEPEEQPSIPTLSVSPTELSVAQTGGTATITVTSNRPWSISTDADWLAFNPSQGGASDAAVSVTVTALANTASDRAGSFKVKTDFDYRTVAVTQPGPQGVDPTQTATGKGTADDPYNTIAAIEAVSGLTWTSTTDYQTTGNVYVKGKISRIAEKGTFTDGGSYGNASFYFSPDGSNNNEFYAYRILYLGNKKFKSGQTDIKVGDEVIICGKLMNYKGNTPETDAGAAYLYSLNGETQGGGGSSAEPKGTGTLDDPYNPAGANAAASSLTWTSTSDYQTTDKVYIKGKISRIADNGTFTQGGSYGNASFYITEDGNDGEEFYAFRILYLGNNKYKSGQTDIKVGDEVVIYGKVMNYRNNTPETEAGAAYLYSLNGETGGGGQGGDEGEPKGTGTLDDPYNPAGAAAAVKNLTWTANDNYQTTDIVYVKGKISKIADKGTFTEGSTYGNASFYISEDGTSAGEFYVFRTLYLGNKKYVEGQTDIKVGDEVIICGKLMNYRGNTPETEAGNSYVYSLNGETGEGGGVDPSEYENAEAKTVAQFIAAADKETYYKLTGTVSGYSAQNCRFDITDETGKIYVYEVANKAAWSSKISNGGTVTLAGKYDFYDAKEQHEVVSAQILSFEAGETPSEKEATVAEAVAAEKGAVLKVGPAVVVAASATGFLMEQDGARIYVYKGVAKVGDNVTVTATVGEYGNAPQLSDATVVVNSTGATVSYPDTKDINSTFGTYSSETREFVTFKGKLSISSGKYFNITVAGATVVGSILQPVEDITSMNDKDVTVKGYYLYHTTSKDGTTYLYVIATEINGKAITGEDDGSGGGGGDATGDFSSNVEWTKGENATDAKATINGKSDVPCLKLGTSSKVGKGTIVLPKGTTSVTFYAVAWKGAKTTTVTFMAGNKELFSQVVAANDGATGNPPFTMTVKSSDCYTKTFEALAADTEVTISSDLRSILFGINVK
ncbi:MAG: BACON domain-containing protein [Bacteroidales bacterium]|nr:BACON domain-containing protein [Bacteroidales bacterium]